MAVKYKFDPKRKEWATLVYDGSLNPDGSKHRKRISSKKSSKDLENKVAEFKASVDRGSNLSNVTLKEYAEKWLDLYKTNTEMNTNFMYKNALHYFEPIEHLRVIDLTRSHFQQVINMNKDHPRTCIIISQTLKQVLKSAVYDNILSDTDYRNITTNITMPKYRKKERSPLSEIETEALLNCDLPERERVFVSILYYGGLRKGEALALEKSDFNAQNRTLTINKVIVFNHNQPELKPYPKSDNSIRVLPLSRPLFEVLEKYTANCTSTLFKSKNKPYMTDSTYRQMMYNIQRSCEAYYLTHGIEPPEEKLTAHRLRHNFCTLLCYQTPRISTKNIARLMGDTEAMVLNVYSHILEDKEDVLGALEDAFLITK